MPPDHNTPRAELERYLQALKDSASHHKDGMERTKENYQDFSGFTFSQCAICGYYGVNSRSDYENCSNCFLDNGSGQRDNVCCTEVHKCASALNTGNYNGYIKHQTALYNQICAEIARVEELIKGKSKKSKRPRYHGW